MEIITNNSIDDETLLNTVLQSFEETKGIKVLSIHKDGGLIYGIYIIPPQQSLSFTQMPLFDMQTTLEDFNIMMVELGQLLIASYRLGDILNYKKLITPSQIKIPNDLFSTLVSKCINNPPLLQINQNLIEWIERTDEVLPVRTATFCLLFDIYKKINNDLDVDTELSTSTYNASQILNEFNSVKTQLKSMKVKKINELTMQQIDDIYIQLQIDLYMTDDK